MSAMNASIIPTTHRVALITAIGQPYEIRIDHALTPRPEELAPGQCLVRMEYAGLCHSDLHVRNADWGMVPAPMTIPGHEGVGRVVALGPQAGQIKIGDRVGLKWIANTCGSCEWCWCGEDASCPKHLVHGYNANGTFAEYTVAYANYVTPIPPEVSSADAVSILCAGLSVYSALKKSNTKVGDWIAVSGAGGGLGHLAVQYAIAMGLRVLAIDTGEDKKNLTLSLGAEKWVDFKAVSGEQGGLVAAVKAATDGGPRATVIVTSSIQPYIDATQYLCSSGTLVVMGAPSTPLQVPAVLFVAKALKIVGSVVGNRQSCIEALDLVARGKVKCHYQVRGWDKLNQTFVDMEQGKYAGRVILKI